MCGYHYDNEGANSTEQLTLKLTETRELLYKSKTYDTEYTKRWTRSYGASTQETRINQRTISVFSNAFSMVLDNNSKYVSSLSQLHNLTDKFYDKEKDGYTVDVDTYKRNDSWLFSIPQDYLYIASFITQDE